MKLPRSLVQEFAKVTNDTPAKKESPKYVKGTVSGKGETKYVKIDGSTVATPISETVDVQDGDRVLVSIENHRAVVLGNFTFPPSARKEQEALDKSESANTNSNAALDAAKDAQTNATEALESSSVASSQAQEAQKKAEESMTAADAASQKANEAKQESAQAKQDAASAKQNAADALSNVANAQEEIDKIRDNVEIVQGDITGALEDLHNQANEIADIKETYTTKIETDNVKADLTTEISKKVGELQATVEENYASKNEVTSIEGKLQTQITQNAEGLKTHAGKIEKVESDTAAAQQQVNQALSKAEQAQNDADAAQNAASKAQTAADAAKENAETAQQKAKDANDLALEAQLNAHIADEALTAARTKLDEAKKNYDSVVNNPESTTEQIAQAQKLVDEAVAAVNKALADATTAAYAAEKAQEKADTAELEAQQAQQSATDAQEKADQATTAANNAQTKAEQAQKDVAELTHRVTTAETNIKQNSEEIELNASKTEEIGNSLKNNYYSKTETDAAIKLESDRISQSVTEKVETVKSSSLTKTEEEFYLSTSPTSLAGGSWSKTQPTWTDGKYIWRRTLVTKGDGSTSYTPSQNGVCITGNTGAQGPQGATGKGIKTITNYYLASASSSGVTDATSGWTTTIQSISASKKYLWNYELITYTDNSTSKTAPCIIGAYGDKGPTGSAGTAGVGISSITEYYQVSTSNTTAPISWVTTVPTLTSTNKYLWNYEKITYTNSTSKETAKRVIGVYGDKGATGPTGPSGADGKGIKYTAITYQASSSGTTIPTGSWLSSIPTVSAGQYLWTRTVTGYTDNTTTTGYSVGKMGEKGPTGPAGANGKPGADGKGVKSTAITYQAGASQTTVPSGSWSTSIPKTTSALPYLWTRTVITYTDNTTSTSYSVSSTLDSVEIGGRNLLLNSNFKNANRNWALENVTASVIHDEIYNNTLAITHTKGDYGINSERIYQIRPNMFVVAHTTYSLSFYAKADSNLTLVQATGGTNNPKEFNLTTNWTKFTRIFDSGTVTGSLTFYLKTAGTYQLANVKLEKGNKPTDWSPAPEDVQEDIKDSIDDATTAITEEYRSAIDQTSKQIELMIQSLKTETDANTESITSVTNQLQITTEMAQFVKTTTEQLQNAIDGKISTEEIREWARFDGASLELGASNSPFKAILSNTELAFWQGDTKVAYISNNELYILSAVIVTSIKCGNFTFIDEGSLGFSLI